MHVHVYNIMKCFWASLGADQHFNAQHNARAETQKKQKQKQKNKKKPLQTDNMTAMLCAM